MKVVIWGAGRVGVPLARAAHDAGHQVTLLTRRPERLNLEEFPFKLMWREDVQDWRSVELLILSVAFEDRSKYPSEGLVDCELSSLALLPEGTAYASVVGSLSLDRLRQALPGRAVTRFMCSPAVVDPSSVRFFDTNGDDRANKLLAAALPGKTWRGASSKVFDRMTRTFVGAAAVCAVLMEYERLLTEEGTECDLAFLEEAVQEVPRLLRCNGWVPSLAFASTATPGGMSRRVFELLFHRPYHDTSG